ncbi:primase-helicase family protein [Pseudomonadota bacterium]
MPDLNELWPDADNEVELDQEITAEISLDDFRAHMPDHRYIFTPTRDLWPAASVDARIDWPEGPDGNKIRPSRWLDANASVEQMTWAPGLPMLIEHKLIDTGGWIDHLGCTCFNLYRPPTLKHGDPDQAGPWIDHIERVYPDDADHIMMWLAQRVQYPQVKLNHALVLGGKHGIGKDTILEPIKYAVGPWNCHEVSPGAMLGRFNGFVKSVILRVSEARDLGDVDRFAFYDHTKSLIAAPPDVIRCDEKNVREYPVPNLCGVIITTNHKSDGLYLPADDRRHYVAWSDLDRDQFETDYWNTIWDWYGNGGIGHVAAYLTSLDLDGFDPKAPPRKTDAFWHIVNSARAPEESELADTLDALYWPTSITLSDIVTQATIHHPDFAEWLKDRRNRRQIPHRLESAGYEPLRNEFAKDGLWRIDKKRQVVYAKNGISLADRLNAAKKLCR